MKRPTEKAQEWLWNHFLIEVPENCDLIRYMVRLKQNHIKTQIYESCWLGEQQPTIEVETEYCTITFLKMNGKEIAFDTEEGELVIYES